jgi:hypothetical protein
MECVMMEQVKPNLIIAGVIKGGTTSLFSYLSRHPDICPASVKEPRYFVSLMYDEEMTPLSEYLRYFRHYQGEKYVMEASPGYFYGGGTVARAIKDTLGAVKIILIFREPVQRLLSFFTYKKSMTELDQNLSLDDYVKACRALPAQEFRVRKNNKYWGVRGGFYIDYLQDWYEVFGDAVKVVFFDHLKASPLLLMRDICTWLEIDAAVYDNTLEWGVENKTVSYKNRKLHRLAIKTNKHSERFLRTHPWLKKSIRNVYYSFNGRQRQEDVYDGTIESLRQIYQQYNNRMAVELSKMGLSKLPEWMDI